MAVDLVRRIHAEMGLAICVVEHVMEVVMPLSHRVVVLDHGEKLTRACSTATWSGGRTSGCSGRATA